LDCTTCNHYTTSAGKEATAGHFLSKQWIAGIIRHFLWRQAEQSAWIAQRAIIIPQTITGDPEISLFPNRLSSLHM
ncbi:MAG: hypothetical protein ACLSD8_08690, partial [[Ruminococcus] torques]|uniref:hypothetical protein n=1 Tax=[Ruminococcus] torques TaxID=33039 RepID=UPI00399607A9